jgi:hypothetical protein
MSLFELLGGMAKIKLAQHNAPPKVHTLTPENLSQEAMVEISPVSQILASSAGSLVPEIAGKNIISAVGLLSVVGTGVYRSYLSNGEGAFIQTVSQGPSLVSIETKLFTPYAEIFPTSSRDPNDALSWNFWLAATDGYIGAPIMQGKNEDGAHQYMRLFSPADNNRIEPIVVTETIIDADGVTQVLQHRFMEYSRMLNETVKEYLFVSAIESTLSASISMWLGLDLASSDLTVYPASAM